MMHRFVVSARTGTATKEYDVGKINNISEWNIAAFVHLISNMPTVSVISGLYNSYQCSLAPG
jgi:hypothetical protein